MNKFDLDLEPEATAGDFYPGRRSFEAPAPLAARFWAWLISQPYVLGVDLSHWNASVDFKALKAAGFEFAILKATEQVSYTDPTFAARWPAALDADMLVGPYHFLRSNYSGIDQADHHLNVIAPLVTATQGRIIPPMDDVETADGVTVAVCQKAITTWHSCVRSALNLIPLCYSSPGLWPTLTNNMALDCYGFTAHWTSAGAPSWPVGWPIEKRKFWQIGVYPKHSWVPVVPGVTGEVDVIRFLGTLPDLRALVGITELSDAEKLDRLWAAHPELHG